MLLADTSWATISSLATGAGTLVLAVATFASVRSANRSTRIAEAALQEQRRPVLAPSRLDDPLQKLMFADGHWVSLEGARATAETAGSCLYLAISLRNVGSGIAVCQGWTARPGMTLTREMPDHMPEEQFRPQTRDLYIPAGDIGMWQGALRHPDDPVRAALAEAVEAHEPVTVELLYSDQVGRQRTITRFGLLYVDDGWHTSMSRHWHLDWEGPRQASEVEVAVATVLDEFDAAADRAEPSSHDA